MARALNVGSRHVGSFPSPSLSGGCEGPLCGLLLQALDRFGGKLAVCVVEAGNPHLRL